MARPARPRAVDEDLVTADDLELLRSLYPFPDPHRAPRQGPLAFGGDLSAGRLLSAYSQGIFPWYDLDVPILWWSPDPRFVLYPAELRVNARLARSVRNSGLRLTVDTAFDEVIRACARAERPDQDGTWITRGMVEAYSDLHRLGFAHSVETWLEGELVGGLYGVSLGAVFFGESMFHRVRDASKVALVRLLGILEASGCTVVDCQQETEHLARFGARAVPRSEFLARLADGLASPTRRGPWSI